MQNEVTQNGVTQNEVTQNEVTQNEVTQNEVTQNEVTLTQQNQYIKILYLSILETKFKDNVQQNQNKSVGKIPKDTPNYMGYIFTHLLWNFWLKCRNITSRIIGFHKLVENTFMTTKDLNDLYIINGCIGNLWRAFNKLAKIWKWRRAKIYNTEDLYMNPITPGQKNTITIMKNTTKYVFNLKELIGNFNRELSNSCNMFIQPLSCKNPYTNEFFSKSDLCNIYFAIKESTYLMPRLIHEYFLCDFSLSRFMNEKEDIIHEFYVDNYTNNITTDVLLKTIKQMLIEHKITGIRIHRDFPKSVLKEKMMPYLKLYYINKMSINKWKKASSYVKLHRMLHDLVNDSPGFGRKKYVPTVSNNGNKSYLKFYYDDKMPKNCVESLAEYMTNHLDLKIRDTSYLMIHYDVIMNQRRRILTSMPLSNQRQSLYVSSDDNNSDNNSDNDLDNQTRLNLTFMENSESVESDNNSDSDSDSDSETENEN